MASFFQLAIIISTYSNDNNKPQVNLPKDIGLIELNKHKWFYEVSKSGSIKIEDLGVVKKLQYHSIPQFRADNIIAIKVKDMFLTL